MSRFSAAALLLLLAPAPARAAAAPGSYDLFPAAAEGSARYVALGGAIVAAPKDYAATFINPAGLGGLAGDGIDFGSDSSSVDNYVLDPSQPNAKSLSDPLKFSFYGVRFVSESGWGIGAAVQTPYVMDDLFSGTARTRRGGVVSSGQDVTEIQAQSKIYTVAAGKSWLDKRLSAGLALNLNQVTEKYDFAPVFPGTAPAHVTAGSSAVSADLGVIGRPFSWLRVGAVYKMGYRAGFASDLNRSAIGTSGPVSAFRDAKSPDRIVAGLAVSPNAYWNLFVQGTYVAPLKDSLIVGSNLFPSVRNTLAVQRADSFSGAWGLEFVPIDEPDLTVRFWGGGYLEDTGVQGGYVRYHRTAGVGISPWFLSFNMAIDDAEYYNNFTVGLGVDILEVASRTAKRWGYTLPL